MEQINIRLSDDQKRKLHRIRDALVLTGCIAAALVLWYVTR